VAFRNTLRLALAGVAIGLAAGPFFLSDTQLGVLADFFSMLVLAILWNLLAGYADIVTIGQHAFVGVGAYAFYAFAALAGVDPYLSIPLAGVVALIIAVPTMALLFRLRTAYFSIGTWVVAEVMMLGAGKIEAFGGGSGISVPIEILRAFGSTRSGRLATIYWLGFVLAAFALGSTYLLLALRRRFDGDARERGKRCIGWRQCRARAFSAFSGLRPCWELRALSLHCKN
jgi:branched-chain amino acid transport system permease protein